MTESDSSAIYSAKSLATLKPKPTVCTEILKNPQSTVHCTVHYTHWRRQPLDTGVRAPSTYNNSCFLLQLGTVQSASSALGVLDDCALYTNPRNRSLTHSLTHSKYDSNLSCQISSGFCVPQLLTLVYFTFNWKNGCGVSFFISQCIGILCYWPLSHSRLVLCPSSH